MLGTEKLTKHGKFYNLVMEFAQVVLRIMVAIAMFPSIVIDKKQSLNRMYSRLHYWVLNIPN